MRVIENWLATRLLYSYLVGCIVVYLDVLSRSDPSFVPGKFPTVSLPTLMISEPCHWSNPIAYFFVLKVKSLPNSSSYSIIFLELSISFVSGTQTPTGHIWQQLAITTTQQTCGGFHKWWYANSWMLYFMENTGTIYKWGWFMGIRTPRSSIWLGFS